MNLNGMGHKDNHNKVDEFWLKLDTWSNLASFSGAKVPTPVEYYNGVL